MSQLLGCLLLAFLIACFLLGDFCIKYVVSKVQRNNLWFGSNADKTRTEVLFLSLAVCWISYFAVIIATGMYHQFRRWEYLYVCGLMALVYFVVPYVLGVEESKPFLERYYVKANVWIAILSYVGNFYWTHYFYNLLGAKYTFDAHRLNDVPISMYFATHAYFCFYHSLTNVCIRRMRRTGAYAKSTEVQQYLLDSVFIGFLAYLTAFMETKTIEGFTYWEFENRDRALVVGSVVYMIYFIVSFPMFLRVDEQNKNTRTERITRSTSKKIASWSMTRVVWDSLGSCMLVTILLDIWRLVIGKVY